MVANFDLGGRNLTPVCWCSGLPVIRGHPSQPLYVLSTASCQHCAQWHISAAVACRATLTRSEPSAHLHRPTAMGRQRCPLKSCCPSRGRPTAASPPRPQPPPRHPEPAGASAWPRATAAAASSLRAILPLRSTVSSTACRWHSGHRPSLPPCRRQTPCRLRHASSPRPKSPCRCRRTARASKTMPRPPGAGRRTRAERQSAATARTDVHGAAPCRRASRPRAAAAPAGPRPRGPAGR
mmetsp:Transcript_57743/g.187577  ORF Transcript_57743/g.187577 Transcript_57743/m.187577 type:complete len:238 (-) Transcript_57743:1338-2051(-)